MARKPTKAHDEDDDQGAIEFIESMPTEVDAEEQADTQWLIEHYAEVVEKYPMSWVAVQDRRVIGHGATPQRAMKDAIAHLGEPDGHPQDSEYEAEAPKHAKNPHLYFIERTADWFLEH